MLRTQLEPHRAKLSIWPDAQGATTGYQSGPRLTYFYFACWPAEAPVHGGVNLADALSAICTVMSIKARRCMVMGECLPAPGVDGHALW